MLETLEIHKDLHEYAIYVDSPSNIIYILFTNPYQTIPYLFVDYFLSYRYFVATVKCNYFSDITNYHQYVYGPFKFENTQQIIDKLNTIKLLK